MMDNRGMKQVREGLGRVLCLPTAYFFAGGRARWPLSKDEAYSAFLEVRFCWIGVAIAGWGVMSGQFSDLIGCLPSLGARSYTI